MRKRPWFRPPGQFPRYFGAQIDHTTQIESNLSACAAVSDTAANGCSELSIRVIAALILHRLVQERGRFLSSSD